MWISFLPFLDALVKKIYFYFFMKRLRLFFLLFFSVLFQTEDHFTRRRLVMEILFSLVLLNFIAINLTDISLLIGATHAPDVFNALLLYLTVMDTQEGVPVDDRFPVFVLTFFLTLSERPSASCTDGVNLKGFIAEKVLPAVIGIVHRVPVVGEWPNSAQFCFVLISILTFFTGFSACRVIVLRLAVLWVDTVVFQELALSVDDHILAVLLDAREQSCLSLRRFYKV